MDIAFLYASLSNCLHFRPWSSRTSPETPEDFILVQPSAQSLRRGSAMLTPTSLVNRFPLAMHSQTGSASSMVSACMIEMIH